MGHYRPELFRPSYLQRHHNHGQGRTARQNARMLGVEGHSDGLWEDSKMDSRDDYDLDDISSQTNSFRGDRTPTAEYHEEGTTGSYSWKGVSGIAQTERFMDETQEKNQEVGVETEDNMPDDMNNKSHAMSGRTNGEPKDMDERITTKVKANAYTAANGDVTSHVNVQNQSTYNESVWNDTIDHVDGGAGYTTVITDPHKASTGHYTKFTEEVLTRTFPPNNETLVIPNSTQVFLGATDGSSDNVTQVTSLSDMNSTLIQYEQYSPNISGSVSTENAAGTQTLFTLEEDSVITTQTPPNLVSEQAEVKESISVSETEVKTTIDLGLLPFVTSFPVLRDIDFLASTKQSCIDCDTTWEQGDELDDLGATGQPSMVSETSQDEGEKPRLTLIHVLLLFVAVLGAGFLMFTNLLGVCCCQNYFKTHGGGPVSDVLYRPVTFSQRRYLSRRSSSRERNRDSMIRRIAEERLHFGSQRGSQRAENPSGKNEDVTRGSHQTVVNMELLEATRRQGNHWLGSGNRQSVFYS